MSERKVTVEQVRNGYVVTNHDTVTQREVFSDLDQVFVWILSHFEGRWSHGEAKYFGKVAIQRERTEADTEDDC